MHELKLFAGLSNPRLAKEVCDYLKVEQGDALVTTFSDGESRVQINENVRGKDVFLFQSSCNPVNKHLMELLLMIDALKRSSAYRITAVIPYYGYGRQDRKDQPRVPISAKLVADLITTAGADRVLTMDLHAGQIQGFFNIPVDHLYAAPVLLDYVGRRGGQDLVVVSPDAGGVERARAFAKRLQANLAIIDGVHASCSLRSCVGSAERLAFGRGCGDEYDSVERQGRNLPETQNAFRSPVAGRSDQTDSRRRIRQFFVCLILHVKRGLRCSLIWM